jgi:hypothetical protein
MKRKVIWVELMNHLINKICHKQKINKHTQINEKFFRDLFENTRKDRYSAVCVVSVFSRAST